MGLALVGLFLALLAYGVAKEAPSQRIDSALADGRGVVAPAFELPLLADGELPQPLRAKLAQGIADGRLGSAELRSVPFVLNFWASWCVPCRKEAPVLERGWRSARAQGVVFVGLNMQDLTGDARAFMREFRVSYLNVRDKSNAVAIKWGVTGLPETFFVASGGRVVAHVIGAVSDPQLRRGIAAARSGKPLQALAGGAREGTR